MREKSGLEKKLALVDEGIGDDTLRPQKLSIYSLMQIVLAIDASHQI